MVYEMNNYTLENEWFEYLDPPPALKCQSAYSSTMQYSVQKTTQYTTNTICYTTEATACTAQATPYTVHATPYTTQATPYTVQATPYTTQATPYNAQATQYIVQCPTDTTCHNAKSTIYNMEAKPVMPGCEDATTQFKTAAENYTNSTSTGTKMHRNVLSGVTKRKPRTTPLPKPRKTPLPAHKVQENAEKNRQCAARVRVKKANELEELGKSVDILSNQIKDKDDTITDLALALEKERNINANLYDRVSKLVPSE